MTDVAAAPAAARFDQIEALADSLAGLNRTFNRARAQWLARAERDVEWSAHAVLKVLRVEGPMRAGAVAEALQFDPSTVSRLTAALVRDGLIERRADPEDGRATVLVPTPAADAVLADHRTVRVGFFAEMLHDWTSEDLTTFAAMLHRLTAAYDHATAVRPDAARTEVKGTHT